MATQDTIAAASSGYSGDVNHVLNEAVFYSFWRFRGSVQVSRGRVC